MLNVRSQLPQHPTRLLLVCLVILAITTGAWAQMPEDGAAQLQVLPKDLETRELITIMKGFARSLGVRCQHCHVGEEGMPIAEFDFVSDENPNKNIAREMIRMTQQINSTFLPATGREPLQEVTCATCHGGHAKPPSEETPRATPSNSR